MKATLELIAKKTGYSISTISRVLNNKAKLSRISKETVDLIRLEAEKCGYSPNLVAKNLRTNQSRIIGLVVPYLSNPYFSEMANVIIAEAKRVGYTTIVIDTMENEEMQNSAVAMLLSRQVEGIIIVPCGNNPKLLEQTSECGLPIVLVDRYYEQSGLPYVVTNNYQGGKMAATLLIRNGHRRLACIQGPSNTMPNKKRIEGYLSVLKSEGLADDAVIVGNEFSIQNGYMETKLLLNDANPPTAIFALSNTIGLGVLKAIKEAGLRIPEDISLISFDNNIYLDFMEPSITRIGQRIDEMGKLSVKLLHDSISNKKIVSSQIELSPELIMRESLAPIIG